MEALPGCRWRKPGGSALTGVLPPTDISQGCEMTPEVGLKNEASAHAYSIRSSLMPHVRRIVLAGTGVSPLVGRHYYQPLVHVAQAELVCLPWAGLAHVEDAVAFLRSELAGETLSLVGHSQGGLIAAVYASRWPDDVAHVVTIGAPLQGSMLCYLPALFPASLDMRPGNTPRVTCHPGMVNVVGLRDSLVLPYHSGLVSGAKHVRVDCGHLRLPVHPDTLTVVGDVLAEQKVAA